MAKSRADKARAAAEGAWGNPYVQRVIEDAELRENVKVALDNARSAYSRLTNGKTASKVVMDDKKFQKDVRTSAEALRDAATALRDGPKKGKRRRRGGIGSVLLLGIVGAGAAVALSEDLRNKVLDLLFGKEEEFDYTSTTAPAGTPGTATPTPSASANT
jgi:hypothetical protein